MSIYIFSARHYMKQVVEGLLYLHSHNILHRDLTLANLLLTKTMDVVGLSFISYIVIMASMKSQCSHNIYKFESRPIWSNCHVNVK